MTTFRELADTLPEVGCDTPFADGAIGIARPDGRKAEGGKPTFIEPTLTLRVGDPASAAVVLVAAPAAVGKSMFAEALAVDRHAPLWDLGQFPVGSGTFLGKLTETHGIQGLADVTQKLTRGEYCVVLDALDEGYSLARSDNFEAFLADLAKQVIALAPSRVGVVACGRTDTIELTHLLLEDAGVKCSVMDLDFFSPEAARLFVDLRLDEVGHSAHRQFRGPFEEARGALFELVEAAIATDEVAGGINARSFLGYAPVLIALSDYLKVGNYQPLVKHMTGGMRLGTEGGEGLWRFLERIVLDLLRREQPKLVEKLPADVRALIPNDRLTALYSAEEQCDRLLARASGTSSPVINLPPDALPEYEKSVNETLGEHPFVGDGPEGFSSVVFRDYVMAQTLAAPSAAATARTLAHRRSFKPSPLLVRFFVERTRAQPDTRIHPSDLELMYSSAQAEELQDARAGLIVEQTSEGLDAEIITASGELIEFAVANDAGSPLALGRRIARADVSAPSWPVTIGRSGEEARVGPNVSISCDHITVAAASVRIEARNPDEGVTWQARRVEHLAPDFHLAGASRDGFRLFVSEQPSYPWTGFMSEEDFDGGDEPAMIEAVRELKKLVTRFKPSVVPGGALALPTKILDVLVARGRVSGELYAYAVETGLVEVAGKNALLHPQQFGINVVDIRARRASPALRVYLARYLH